MAKIYEINLEYIFLDKRDRSFIFMSRTAITLKFKMRWFPNEGRWRLVNRYEISVSYA